MRSCGLTPSAFNPLATRLVNLSNSAKVVCRPSNSRTISAPRDFASVRTISARFAGADETDMSSSRCLALVWRNIGVVARQRQYGEMPGIRSFASLPGRHFCECWNQRTTGVLNPKFAHASGPNLANFGLNRTPETMNPVWWFRSSLDELAAEPKRTSEPHTGKYRFLVELGI